MNIDDYRAIKAQEATQKTEQTQTATVTPDVKIEQITASVTPDVKPNDTPKEENKLPEKITIDGIGEVTLDELKNGYLRTSDYTKKTQEIANQRKESEDAIKFYENLKQNPQMIEQLKQVAPIPNTLDPATAKVVELENKVYDMMLQSEINVLQTKYPDFEVRTVLQTAKDKGLTNLEDAYKLSRNITPPDATTLKEQLRQEIINELKAEKTATSTLITSNSGAPITSDNQPHISEAEAKVARNMKMSLEDYVKWRDIDKKKK